MFGRAPMMPPAFAPGYPAPSYPQPQYIAPPRLLTAPATPLPATPPAAPAPAAVAPIVRFQMDDEATAPVRPAVPLVMPSPEQLGITAARPTSADWLEARRRLDRLGAQCFQLEKLAGGGCRFVCLLPTDQVGRARRVEAQAATEAEAVSRALEEAERWSQARQ